MKIQSKPFLARRFLLKEPISFFINGEKVTRSGLRPKLNFNFNAIELESLPPDQGTTQS